MDNGRTMMKTGKNAMYTLLEMMRVMKIVFSTTMAAFSLEMLPTRTRKASV